MIVQRAHRQSPAYRVVTDVPRFFDLMREVGAILAGSAVLHMLCPLFDAVQDYDFFVPSDHLYTLAHYLILEEGFEMENLNEREGTNGCMIEDLRYLAGIGSRITLRKGTVIVDVIAVGAADDWDCAYAVIASAWTTLLFNYAGPDEIMVGYPTLTLLGRGLIQWDRALHPSFPHGTRMEELEKYVERGYQFRTQADDWDVTTEGQLRPCVESWVCPLRKRAFGDGGCLVVAMGRRASRRDTVGWLFGGKPCPLVCDKERTARNEVHVEWCACGSTGA